MLQLFNNWCHFGYVNIDSLNFLAQTVRFEISTATNVRDTNNTQNVAYTILFKTTGSFSHFKQSDNPANTGNFYGNIVGFALSTNPNSVNTIDFRVTQITIGSSTRFKFYYRPNTGIQGKTIVVVHNENFVVANQTNIDTLPDEPIYLNTPFSYVSLSGGVLDYYTKAEIDAKTTVLQAGIDITYTKVESDAKYRLITDSYTKTEVNDRLALKIDTLTLANYYTRFETDLKLGLKADFNVGQLPNFF